MEKNEIVDFVRQMKATDHAILFYERTEDKHSVLFNYLSAGLDKGEAAAYITSQETPNQIREAMKQFGIDVDKLEKSGVLQAIDYRDWYFKDGTFTISKTFEAWKKLYDQVMAKGFKGIRVTGETACFFEKRKVDELVEYEKSLHRKVELPMSVICAYDANVVAREGDGRLYLDLIKAHSTVIFADSEGSAIKSL